MREQLLKPAIRCIIATLLWSTPYMADAQEKIMDTAHTGYHYPCSCNQPHKLSTKRLVLPAVFISYGIASLTIDGLKNLNRTTRDEIGEDKPSRSHIDNFTQYAPALMVYGLNAAGVKGIHNFKDRTIIFVTSQLVTAAIVVPLKHLVKETRPDSSDNLSFPSGHTATAFATAQFMFREYKDQHPWLALSGYSFAIFTGVYRTINNKHWVGDVVAGAGIGMLSTELAYWLYPAMQKLFKGKKSTTSAMLLPYYESGGLGLQWVSNF